MRCRPNIKNGNPSTAQNTQEMSSPYSCIQNAVLLPERIQTKRRKKASLDQTMQQERTEADDRQMQISWRYIWLEQSSISERLQKSCKCSQFDETTDSNSHVNIATRSKPHSHEWVTKSRTSRTTKRYPKVNNTAVQSFWWYNRLESNPI